MHPSPPWIAFVRRATAFWFAFSMLAMTPHVAAAASRATVLVEDGASVSGEWLDCAPRSFEVDTTAPMDARPLPDVGDFVDDTEMVVVAFRRDGSLAIWDIAPSPALCGESAAINEQLTDVPLRMRWTTRRYALRAGERSGVRSFAGLRVNDWRQPPTARATRRAFGAPTTIKRGKYQDCTITWARLGLRVVFVNYGGRPACSSGFFQAARITDPSKWAVIVGSRPGIVESSAPGYLSARLRATETAYGWSLAEVFIPWGDPGYYPSILAKSDELGPIEEYEVWVGAGGD